MFWSKWSSIQTYRAPTHCGFRVMAPEYRDIIELYCNNKNNEIIIIIIKIIV